MTDKPTEKSTCKASGEADGYVVDDAVFEVGVVTAHPLKMAILSAVSILKTWKYARDRGLKLREWYGVYHHGTEILLAQFGCLPGSKQDARRVCQYFNDREAVKRLSKFKNECAARSKDIYT